MFLNRIKSLVYSVYFTIEVVKRFFLLIFRKNKEIEKIYLKYNNKYLFKNSYLIVEYKFKNVLFFKLNNEYFTKKNIILFNIERLEGELKLTVYGFFRKREYKLLFSSELFLVNDNFKISTKNLKLEIDTPLIPQKIIKMVSVRTPDLIIKQPILKPKIEPLKTNHQPFYLNDFI